MSNTPKIEDIVLKYRDIRDNIAAEKKKFEEWVKAEEQKLSTIEAYLLREMQALGVTSFPTEHGTAYQSNLEKFNVTDKVAFMSYIKEHAEPELLQLRASSTALKEFRTNNGQLPPGIEAFSEISINIRKA